MHAHATLSETLRGHRLDAQVQGYDGCDRGCEPVELVRLNGVGGVNRNGVSELTACHRLGGAHLLQQFSFGAFCVLTGEHARTHRTARTQAAGQGASVNALNTDDALLDELFVEGALRTPAGCHTCGVTNHVAGNPNLGGFSVGGVHTGVANMGSGLNHNLTRVGGVGQGFLVAGHAGRENRLAQGRAGCAVAIAAVDGAVLQDEQRAVRTQGAGSCHVSHALFSFSVVLSPAGLAVSAARCVGDSLLLPGRAVLPARAKSRVSCCVVFGFGAGYVAGSAGVRCAAYLACSVPSAGSAAHFSGASTAFGAMRRSSSRAACLSSA